LLAQFRCDEIAAAALEEFNTQARAFKRPIETGKVVEDLGKMMRNWYNGALSSCAFISYILTILTLLPSARFDTAASRYHQGVYQRKRQDFIAQLGAALLPLFTGQLKNLHRQVLSNFKADLTNGVRVGGEYDFGSIVTEARQRAESTFESGAKEALGVTNSAQGVDEPIDAEWVYEDEFEQLKSEMSLVADQFRKDETKKMVNSIEVRVSILVCLASISHMITAHI
jgi:protein SEY1